MDLIEVLRLLWRRRLLVAIGAGIAIVAAILVAFEVHLKGSPRIESRQYDVGVASASVLVDSQSSQVVDLGGEGDQAGLDVTSLASRARLLATLISTRPLKDQIAAAAGIPSHRLIGHVAAAQPDVAPAPVTTGTTVSADDPEANIMTLQTAETLPIITINTQAANEAVAESLATLTVGELTRYMKSVAAGNQVPSARQLVVTPLGPATSTTIEKGPRRLWAVVVFWSVVAAWCAGIVMITSVARTWRDSARVEALQAESGPRPGRVEAPETPPARLDGAVRSVRERASRSTLVGS